MKKLFLPLLLLAVVLTAIGSPGSGESDPPVPPQHSALWGEAGELWDPVNGPLRDFTDVGYMGGDVPIPDWPVWANLTDLGAIPDDHISDVAVLREAIANCPPYHAIFLPDGVYIIDDELDVTANNIVIRGESRDGVILYFPKHMNEIKGVQTTDVPFIKFIGGSNRGIENLSLVFRDEQKATGYVDRGWSKQNDPHWWYNGENPIAFDNYENDSWMRNIYIKNANHGIRVDKSSNISVINVVVDQFIGRRGLEESNVGHMGIKVGDGASHILVHNILITGNWVHDICVMGVTDSVFSRISGPNVKLDHHANGNVRNLYTEVNYGDWSGYGEDYNNFNETYWGLNGYNDAPYLPTSRQSVFVGVRSNELTNIGTNYHHETLDPNLLEPANIYLAQLAHLNKSAPADVPLTLPATTAPYRLLAVDDAHTNSGSANTNYGANSSMSFKGSIREGFMKFDLSSLGITNADTVKLKFYVESLWPQPFGLKVMAVSDDSWSERTITHNYRPAAGAVLTTVNMTGGGWYELDLTSYVNSELAGDQIVSIKLTGGAPGHNKDAMATLRSSEGGNAAELVVHVDASTVSAPATPTSLTTMTPGDKRILLEWADNAESDFASYNVYRHAGDGNFVIEAMGLTSSKYEDSVVANGATYYYKVTAVDTAGTESLQGIEVAVHVLLDTDGDGMDDLWEEIHFPEPPGSDGTIDSDGDGVLDFFEYLYGSIPTDRNDGGFRFEVSGGQGGTNAELDWTVKDGMALGRDYLLAFSTDLAAWVPVPEEHYTMETTRQEGRTRMKLTMTHDHGDKAFFRLVQPRTSP